MKLTANRCMRCSEATTMPITAVLRDVMSLAAREPTCEYNSCVPRTYLGHSCVELHQGSSIYHGCHAYRLLTLLQVVACGFHFAQAKVPGRAAICALSLRSMARETRINTSIPDTATNILKMKLCWPMFSSLIFDRFECPNHQHRTPRQNHPSAG